jgi:uncharacterized repeat protein (TIGR04138 family)
MSGAAAVAMPRKNRPTKTATLRELPAIAPVTQVDATGHLVVPAATRDNLAAINVAAKARARVNRRAIDLRNQIAAKEIRLRAKASHRSARKPTTNYTGKTCRKRRHRPIQPPICRLISLPLRSSSHRPMSLPTPVDPLHRSFLSSRNPAVSQSMTPDIHPLIKLLCEDRRYKLEAYQFVRSGLEYAQDVLELGRHEETTLPEGEVRQVRHVTGQDLSHALRLYAHDQYGFMAKLVLAGWGIHSTSDFGEIVYNLIKIGEMTKSPEDRREDFDQVFDFDQALVQDFVITAAEEAA